MKDVRVGMATEKTDQTEKKSDVSVSRRHGALLMRRSRGKKMKPVSGREDILFSNQAGQAVILLKEKSPDVPVELWISAAMNVAERHRQQSYKNHEMICWPRAPYLDQEQISGYLIEWPTMPFSLDALMEKGIREVNAGGNWLFMWRVCLQLAKLYEDIEKLECSLPAIFPEDIVVGKEANPRLLQLKGLYMPAGDMMHHSFLCWRQEPHQSLVPSYINHQTKPLIASRYGLASIIRQLLLPPEIRQNKRESDQFVRLYMPYEMQNLLLGSTIEGKNEPASPSVWWEALNRCVDLLGSCRMMSGHIHFRHAECPWCHHAKENLVDLFPSAISVQQGQPERLMELERGLRGGNEREIARLWLSSADIRSTLPGNLAKPLVEAIFAMDSFVRLWHSDPHDFVMLAKFWQEHPEIASLKAASNEKLQEGTIAETGDKAQKLLQRLEHLCQLIETAEETGETSAAFEKRLLTEAACLQHWLDRPEASLIAERLKLAEDRLRFLNDINDARAADEGVLVAIWDAGQHLTKNLVECRLVTKEVERARIIVEAVNEFVTMAGKRDCDEQKLLDFWRKQPELTYSRMAMKPHSALGHITPYARVLLAWQRRQIQDLLLKTERQGRDSAGFVTLEGEKIIVETAQKHRALLAEWPAASYWHGRIALAEQRVRDWQALEHAVEAKDDESILKIWGTGRYLAPLKPRPEMIKALENARNKRFSETRKYTPANIIAMEARVAEIG
ncbi:MAG: hypothetical protein ACOYK8_07665 [Alphaproteobacteria bacterium]